MILSSSVYISIYIYSMRKALIKKMAQYILMLLVCKVYKSRYKANVIKVFCEDMTVLQYFDNITNKEYNFISGTFIIDCKLHCIQLEEINRHFERV